MGNRGAPKRTGVRDALPFLIFLTGGFCMTKVDNFTDEELQELVYQS